MKTMLDKPRYCEWAPSQPQLPIYMQPWWMDAVCAGKEWDAMLWVDENEDIVAAMPFLIRRRLGIRYILMPQQTQIGGIYLPDGNELTGEDIRSALDSLRLAYYQQHYPIDSPLPALLQQQGFKIKPKVTYRIEDLTDLNAVISRFSKNKRRQLEKALALHVVTDLTAEQFYTFHTNCLRAQRKSISYSREFFLVLAQKSRKRGQSQIIAIADADNHLCAAAFAVWDKHSLNYLIPCYHPTYKDSGAGALLVLEAIKLARDKGVLFDFEGSSIRGVAQHYKQFGSTPSTFYNVQRYYKWWFRLPIWWNKLRNWKK